MMKRQNRIWLSWFGALSLLLSTGWAGTPVDITSSQVEWFASKVTGKHNGDVKLVSGFVKTDKDQIVDAEFVIDMQSIRVLDIESPGMRSKLEGHLKAEDFFHSSKYPQAIFRLSSARKLTATEGANFRLTGDLQIRGITHAIAFDAQVDLDQTPMRATGTMTVDRTKYGITYKSGSVFQALGDRAIHDDFQIKFHILTH